MNDIIKYRHNIRKGQEWFDMMPKQLQERWLLYTREDIKNEILTDKKTFRKFLYQSFVFSQTEEGHLYWDRISEGYFVPQKTKKSLWSKILNFFKL